MVELGENFIKVAEVVLSKGKREIARLVKRPFRASEAGETDEALEVRNIFESLNIPHHPVRLNIPRHLVTVRFIKLPSTSEDEIRKMTRIESLKHVPYSDENVVSGYKIIERMPDGYSNVLIAVAQADTIQREADILKKAGLFVESVSLGSETLLLWYLAAREAEEAGTILLVNIDAGHIDIDVVAGNKLIFTRGVLSSLVETIPVERIIEEINVSIAAYRKESGKLIDKVVLSGMPASVDELKTLLAAKVKIPIDVIDQMKGIARRQDAHLELAEASFVELLGLALRYDGADINLLPETAQEEQRLELVKKNIMTGLIVSVLIIVIGFGAILKKLHDKRAYISYIDSALSKIEPQVKTAKAMAREIDLVASKIAERPLAIDLVSEVFKITPSGITLTMMEYESYKTLTLRGTAPNLSDVFKYVTILGKAQYFKNVKVKYANKRTGQAGGADFEIICPVSKAK